MYLTKTGFRKNPVFKSRRIVHASENWLKLNYESTLLSMPPFSVMNLQEELEENSALK